MGGTEKKARVLFVDDDPVVARAFGRALRPLGLCADLACSAREALQLSGDQSYPLVVTDLRMPDMDGFELVEKLTHKNLETTFVLVTADRDLQLPSNGDVDGRIVSIIKKPWDADELLVTVQRALELHARRCSPGSVPPGGEAALARVLLVEDNPGDALLFTRLLGEIDGLHVTQAACLRDAVGFLRARSYDVVVTDLSLPDARGLDAVLRCQEVAPNAAVVVLTAVDDEALALHAVECGVQDYLLKGKVDGAALVRALRQARERKRSAQRWAELAHTDLVTGLANRSGLQQRVIQALSRARRRAGSLSLLYIDLDGFKAVNDAHGHSTGDELLKVVGSRLTAAVRTYDTVARLGGDEFAVLIEDVGAASVCEFPARILRALGEPMTLGFGTHTLTASIGVASYPSSGNSGEELLQAADQAMYAAKRRGRNRYCMYDGLPLADAAARKG